VKRSSEIRKPRPETRNPKPESRKPKAESELAEGAAAHARGGAFAWQGLSMVSPIPWYTRNPKPETGLGLSKVSRFEPRETLLGTPKPETRNPVYGYGVELRKDLS
jgi:hypothetical protein